MKSFKTTALAASAALALTAAPAFAQETTTPKGQTTSPAKICKNESKKKTNKGKGKSPFAACVSGAKKQQAEAMREPNQASQKAPGQMCKNESRKKDADDTKSPFAACVKGVTVTRKAQREAAQQA